MLPTKDMASPAEIPFTIYGTKINYVPHTVDLFLIQEKTAASSLAASHCITYMLTNKICNLCKNSLKFPKIGH